jgi:hypothetical protein
MCRSAPGTQTPLAAPVRIQPGTGAAFLRCLDRLCLVQEFRTIGRDVPRFNALRTPIRVNIAGPLFSTTRSSACDRSLPLRELLFSLGKLLDIFGSILEGDDMATARQRDRIIKPSFPAAISHMVDGLAEPLHGEFDILRLQMAPAH